MNLESRTSKLHRIDITPLVNPLEEIMKKETRNNKKDLFKALTPEQAATINGGKHGADDPAGDVKGEGVGHP
jgi:hypothetical protein